MTELSLILVYFFIVGFNVENMGLFEEREHKVLMTLYCLTAGVLSFPFVFGYRVSKFLER